MIRITRSPVLGAAAVVAAVVAMVISLRGGGLELGPHDGHDLPPTDTGRVAVGDVAPDFSLLAYAGDTITLSDAYHDRTIVLVFYRGHW